MVRRSLENHWITVIQTTVFWRAHCGYECTDGRPGICSGPELEGVFVLPTRVAKVGGTFPVRVQGSVFASPPGSEGSLLPPWCPPLARSARALKSAFSGPRGAAPLVLREICCPPWSPPWAGAPTKTLVQGKGEDGKGKGGFIPG